MSDLTAKEQKAVRTALRFLWLRVGASGPLANALRYRWDSIQKVATDKKAVTPALELRVARFAGVPLGELLAGQWLPPPVYHTADTRRMTSSTRTRSPGSRDHGRYTSAPIHFAPSETSSCACCMVTAISIAAARGIPPRAHSASYSFV